MLRPPLQRPLLAFALALPLVAPAAGAVDLYPTDLCVSQKLEATARACRDAIADEGPIARKGKGKGKGKGRKLEKAQQRLRKAWSDAEAQSLAAGVSCSETTESADAVWERMLAGADAVQEAAGPSCGRNGVLAAASACHDLLTAEAYHLQVRDLDREQRFLEQRRSKALARAQRRWAVPGKAKKRGPRCDGDALQESVLDLVDQTLFAATVSPAVPSEWTLYDPPDSLDYEGRTLAPICAHGTPYGYFAKRGSVNKLLVYYQGGGACWDLATCDVLPSFDESFEPAESAGDDPRNYPGLLDLANPENPFRDWNMVFVPYCTGDVHWGDATYEHRVGSASVVIEHKGWVNARAVEKWTREHFVAPEQVFVTGSSAGAYGAIVNSLPMQEFVYPSSDFAVVGDAGNGVITQDFLVNDLAKWGIEQNLPSWIPRLDRPLVELDASELWAAGAAYYPTHRFANYSTAYDGGRGGQIGFYNIMLSEPGNLFAWQLWWRPTCEWNEQMRAASQRTAAESSNYRYYIGTGSRHTIWANDKAYTDTTGGVPRFVDWVRAMLDGSDAWLNVECEDCGTLLGGDPRPNPAQPPYVQVGPAASDQKIVCEDGGS